MISVEDVEDLNIKLLSEKAKVREEGVKALVSYLDGAAGLSLCPLLDYQTALLHPNDRIPSATWPGVLHALCECIVTEVGSSKKRGPKPILSKTLRSFIQKAEDSSRSGKGHILLRKVKRLFQHVLDMLQEVPSFASDYGHILRQLVPDVEYRLRMGKKIYNDLVIFYLVKAKETAHTRSSEAPVAKEDAFRNTLTLLILLRNPPGDFSMHIRDDLVEGFCDIFSFHRDEDRVTKKLVSCLNAILLMDGLNLGDEVAKLHSSVRPFLVRIWLTTRDRELKDELVLYARAQLKLQYILTLDEGSVLDELLGLVEKELDQSGIALTGMHRFDIVREEKVGSVNRGERSFFELAAATLFEVGRRHENGAPYHEKKRRRRENVYSLIKEKISAGKTLWDGAFCFLVKTYGYLLPPVIIGDWLEGLAGNFEREPKDKELQHAIGKGPNLEYERVLAEGINNRAFDVPVWTLRCLQGLSTLWHLATGSSAETFAKRAKPWHSIWESLMHWLPLYSNVPIMVDESFHLLGLVAAMRLLPPHSVSTTFWELPPFKEAPSGNLLFFVAAFFSSSGTQAVTKGDLELRSTLLDWSLKPLDAQEVAKAKVTSSEQVSSLLLSGAIMALSVGFIPLPPSSQSSKHEIQYLTKELVQWSQVHGQSYKDQEMELKSLDRFSFLSSNAGDDASKWDVARPMPRINTLPRSSSDFLLQRLAEILLLKVNLAAQNKTSPALPQLFYLCALLSTCIFGAECSLQRRGQRLPDWCSKGRVWLGLASLLELCQSVLENCKNEMQQITVSSTSSLSSPLSSLSTTFTPGTLSAISSFVLSPGRAALVASGGIANDLDSPTSSAPLLTKILRTFSSLLTITSDMASKTQGDSGTPVSLTEERDGEQNLIDLDLDEFPDSGVTDNGEGKSVPTGWSKKRDSVLYEQWTEGCVHVVTNIGLVLPDMTCGIFLKLMGVESYPKVRWNILLNLCKLIKGTSIVHLSEVVRYMEEFREECQHKEYARCNMFTSINTVLTNILSEERSTRGHSTVFTVKYKRKLTLPEQTVPRLAALVVEIVDMGLLLWHTRAAFALAVSTFILVDPSVAQGLTEKLLGLMHDPEYRVRHLLAERVKVFFETWDGHIGMLQDVCANLGVKMVMVTKDKVVPRSEVVSAGQQAGTFTETAVITLGEIAASSDKVEGEAVFMLCAHAALYPSQRPLVTATLDRVAKQLNYLHRWKYMEYMMGGVLTCWVIARMSLPSLVEIREELKGRMEAEEFLKLCCPWLLPPLFLHEYNDELVWVAEACSLSLSALVKQNFASIFAGLLLLHSFGTQAEQHRAATVLQGNMLIAAQLTEDERDNLIRRHMISIVSCLFRLCSAAQTPQLPYYTNAAVTSAVRTVVDGFLEIDQVSQEEGVVDKMQVFRPDRVFMLLLQLHYEIDAACHPRQRCHLLASLMAIMTVIDKRTVVPSTCRYLIHIILQSIEIDELQQQCCSLLGHVLDKLEALLATDDANILGDQLQSLVSKLLACISAYEDSGGSQLESSAVANNPHTFLVTLLQRLTINASHSLYGAIKELIPFPDLPVFKPMRALHTKLCVGRSLADEFVQFVGRAPSLPPQLQLSSLQSLANQLRTRKGELYTRAEDKRSWRCSPEVVAAGWKLVQLCSEQDLTDMRDLAGIFLSAIGMGDPHAVVFHLPPRNNGDYPMQYPGRVEIGTGATVTTDAELGVSDNLVRAIMLQIRGYLVDNNVQIIELASKSLKGLLSTEMGHRVLKSLTFQESAYLEVHSKGINPNLVQDMLSTAKVDSARLAVSIDEPRLWQTTGESYDVWVSMLVHSLIEYTDSEVLRLIQGLVLNKAPLAELVFPYLLGDLAARLESGNQLNQKVSRQIQEHVFSERNQSTRSIQLFLGALNTLRCCYVTTSMKRPASFSRGRDQSKGDKSFGTSGEGRYASVGKKHSDGAAPESADSGKHHHGILSSWQKVYWLQIDYLTTAKAAQRCAAYFTTVLYVEHWCEESFGGLTLGEPDFSNDDGLPAHLELLLMVYTKINEPDGMYGVVRSHKVRSQLLTYEHEGNWSKALEGYDLLLHSKNSSSDTATPSHSRLSRTTGASADAVMQQSWQNHKGLMKSLQQMGCSHLVNVYNQVLAQQEGGLEHDPEFKELQYEAAWRACVWDMTSFGPETASHIPNILIEGDKGITFHANLHSCIKSLVEGDPEVFYPRLQQAREGIITGLAHSSMESTQTVNPAIMKLQMLECLSQAWEMRWRVSSPANTNLPQVPRMVLAGPLVPSDAQVSAFEMMWQENMRQMHLHYDLLEPYVTFRKVLFQVLNRLDYVPQHLLECAILARKAGRPSHSANAIHELKSLTCGMNGNMSPGIGSSGYSSQTNVVQISSAARVEEGKILWAQGQQELAVNLLKYILQHSDLEAADSAAIHCLTGKWLADTRSDSSRVILDLYFRKAVELMEGTVKSTEKIAGNSERWKQRQCRTHYRLAHYTDALYRSYEDRLMSSEWQAALRLRQHKARELDALMKRYNTQKGNSRDYTMKIFELQKQLALDNEEAQRMQGDKDQFLLLALESYRNCLLTGNKYDLHVVFRLLSLWFNLSADQRVVDAMLETVQKVQTFKFIPLVYQIASRMGSSKENSATKNFQNALTFLVKKMAVDHPYHTIYQLLALANGDRVKENQRGKIAFVVDMDKKHAAEDLLKSLTSYHKELLSQMKRMVEIYIRLAELETTKEDTNKKIPLPRDIRSIRQLEMVPVITAALPVDPGCQYQTGSFPYFKGLSDTVLVMIGINAPKVIECNGSDGRKYKQLAKSGNDDLRQDAVMEQLFGLMNTLLQAHPDTRQRQLCVRTYKVIPFTPSAGVLEWVDGTIPLGEYLLGSTRSGGAHARYGVGDWTFLACREHMSVEKDKRRGYHTVCKNFRPVMHNFFLERFAQASAWFEKRLAYTRSVATSSMVGYVVGLGDRHSMNVLMDQTSAEVVHIDLGVAFEQGLMLKTPERVPFRLTRDIVDGMGVSSVEGIFRRCCEATLAVMRTNKEALLTIIEVFIYDPLYKWALSPLKALQRQQEREPDASDSEELSELEMQDEGNKDAARALLRVKQKLDGYEEGEMRSLQGQVQQLIHDAQDPERLSQMFPGWGAWL